MSRLLSLPRPTRLSPKSPSAPPKPPCTSQASQKSPPPSHSSASRVPLVLRRTQRLRHAPHRLMNLSFSFASSSPPLHNFFVFEAGNPHRRHPGCPSRPFGCSAVHSRRRSVLRLRHASLVAVISLFSGVRSDSSQYQFLGVRCLYILGRTSPNTPDLAFAPFSALLRILQDSDFLFDSAVTPTAYNKPPTILRLSRSFGRPLDGHPLSEDVDCWGEICLRRTRLTHPLLSWRY